MISYSLRWWASKPHSKVVPHETAWLQEERPRIRLEAVFECSLHHVQVSRQQVRSNFILAMDAMWDAHGCYILVIRLSILMMDLKLTSSNQIIYIMFLKLHDWIDERKIEWDWLSANPNAIHRLEANPWMIDWAMLSMNPNAIHLLKPNPDKIDWVNLARNPNAIHLLEANPDNIHWDMLSRNPNAIHLLEANPDRIYWTGLSTNPNALHLLEANPDKIDWRYLSKNLNAIHLLEANQDKIDWWWLSANPNAIHILEANPDKIHWYHLSMNPNAIHILKANPHMIDWSILSMNPGIFTYDYELIRKTNFEKNSCVAEWFNHPRFIQKYVQTYGVEALDDYMA